MNNPQNDLEFRFTKEEINNSYYLDLSVSRLNNNLSVGIYRILTQTDTTLYFISNHPVEHEFAAYIFFHQYYGRLIYYREMEWNIILSIAKLIGFPLYRVFTK
jgi:hypothetical protein